MHFFTWPHMTLLFAIDFLGGLVIGLCCLLEGLGSGEPLEMTVYVRAYSSFVEEAVNFDSLDFGSKAILFIACIMTLLPVLLSYMVFAIARTLYNIFLRTPWNIVRAMWKALD